MKILIADQFNELGGAQQILLEMLPAFARHGWTCVLAIPGRGPVSHRAEELGVRCEDIPCGPFGCGSKSLTDVAKFGAQFPGLRKRLRQLVEEIGPDVFYVMGPRLVPAACSLGGKRPPILFHMHSYLKQRYAVALTGRCLSRARASVAGNCQFVLEPLRPYLQNSRVEVIYNGVRDYAGVAPRPRGGRIGLIGRICPEKGQRLFVEAARIVHDSLPQATFVICGDIQFSDDGAYLGEVTELARGLPVEFTGWRDDIGEVLRGLDLLVVASLPQAEATTRVIPEAYSARVPVLASDLPGIREILSDGETGFLFAAGNSSALATRILEIAGASGETLGRVTDKARVRYEECFALEVFQRRMMACIGAVKGH